MTTKRFSWKETHRKIASEAKAGDGNTLPVLRPHTFNSTQWQTAAQQAFVAVRADPSKMEEIGLSFAATVNNLIAQEVTARSGAIPPLDERATAGASLRICCACRRIRVCLGGLRPSKPPGRVLGQSEPERETKRVLAVLNAF